jgi:hypothetical protein
MARSRVWSEKGKKKMRTIGIRVFVLATALLALAISIAPMSAQEARPPSGRVAYHFVARLLQSPTGTFFVIGYVNFLDGVSAPLFDGTPGVTTAVMTFRSDVFSAAPLFNGNVMVLNWPPAPAPVVKFYLNNSPNQDWDLPNSFSSGQLIGSFGARVGQIVIAGATAVVTYSYDWMSTQNFSLGGKMVNLDRLSPGGGTISNYVSTTLVTTTVSGFPFALTSAGTSFVIGPGSKD